MSILPTMQKVSPNATLLFSTRFSGITISNPDTFSGGGCWRHIAGTDSLTGHSPATAAALPLGVRPPGGGTTGNGGYGFYLINGANGISGYSPQDITGVDAVFPITQSTQTIRGVPTNSVNIRCKDTGTASGFQTQGWLAFYRDLSLASIADLPELCIDYYMTLPDLVNSYLDTTNRYITITDWKTGSASGGDDRFVLGIIKSNGGQPYGGVWRDEDGQTPGTLAFFCQGDNRANLSPDIPAEEYYRIKNFNVTVPINEPFRLRIYRKRGLSYSDTDTHRVRVELIKQDGSQYTLFDINKNFLASWSAQYPYQSPLGASPAGGWPARNIGMGINNSKLQRIMTGLYFGGKANQDVQLQIAGVDLWNGFPGILPTAP